MNESREQNWPRRKGLVVVAVYALNALIIAASYADIGRAIAPKQWYPVDQARLSDIVFSCLIGLTLGQIGCVALWYCLSNQRAIPKVPIFVLAVAQLAGVFAFVMCMDRYRPLSYYQFFLVLSVVLALLTSFALWLSKSRLSMVPLDQLSTKTSVGISMSQSVLATTLVAIVVGIVSRGPLPSNTSRGILIVVVVGALVGLLPSVGLVIGLSSRRLATQFVVGAVVSSVLGVGVTASDHWSVGDLSMNISVLASIILMPVIWIRVIRYLGYGIQSVNRKSLLKDDHPFMDHDAAEESNV